MSRAGAETAPLMMCCLLLSGALAGAASGPQVTGRVQDPAGRAITGAHLSLAAGDRSATGRSDEEGRFALRWDGEPEEATLAVEAQGFTSRREVLRPSEAPALTVVLWPLAFREEVTVAAGRREGVGETAGSVTVLPRADLAITAAPTIDDALRQVPGFSLFRRLGSRWANPTTQGPTLRGLGGNGAARALVLDDGVPLNDPFGGWVYWTRVPGPLVEQVEVRRGGGSHLFGSGALAGVIQIVRPAADPRRLALELSAGTQRTIQGSGFIRGGREGLGIVVAGEGFTTAGYHPLPASARGAVDRRAASGHLTEEVSVEQAWSGGARLFGRGSMFREPRRNGTVLQDNDTELRQLVVGLDLPRLRHILTARAHVSSQLYEQTFTAVAADRQTETLTREQRVDAGGRGLSVRWTRGGGRAPRLTLGGEWTEVEGTNEETAPGRTPAITDARQVRRAAFADLGLALGRRGALTGGARIDRWNNVDAAALEDGRIASFPDRGARALSPQGSFFFRLGSRVALNASAYRAFRAPTLNELYRSFRVGDVLTLANHELRAERLAGGEAGLVATRGPLSLRTQAFRLDVRDPVSNVTLEVASGLITRQRQNLGRIRSQGLEIDAELRFGAVSLGAGLLAAEAKVRSFPADPTLEGKRLPQVPRRQLTLQARCGQPAGFRLGAQARLAGSQWDDDRNQLRLARLRTVDLLAALPLGSSVEIFLAGENVLNERYEVGRTPLTTLGPPRTLRLGVRLHKTARDARPAAPSVLNPTPFGGTNP